MHRRYPKIAHTRKHATALPLAKVEGAAAKLRAQGLANKAVHELAPHELNSLLELQHAGPAGGSVLVRATPSPEAVYKPPDPVVHAAPPPAAPLPAPPPVVHAPPVPIAERGYSPVPIALPQPPPPVAPHTTPGIRERVAEMNERNAQSHRQMVLRHELNRRPPGPPPSPARPPPSPARPPAPKDTAPKVLSAHERNVEATRRLAEEGRAHVEATRRLAAEGRARPASAAAASPVAAPPRIEIEPPSVQAVAAPNIAPPAAGSPPPVAPQAAAAAAAPPVEAAPVTARIAPPGEPPAAASPPPVRSPPRIEIEPPSVQAVAAPPRQPPGATPAAAAPPVEAAPVATPLQPPGVPAGGSGGERVQGPVGANATPQEAAAALPRPDTSAVATPAAAAAPAVEAPPTAAATPVTTPILPPGVSATGGAGELVPGPIVLPGAAPEVAAAPTAAAAAPRGAAPEAAAALPRPDTSYEEMSKHFSPELRAHLQSAYPGGVDPMFHASQVDKANKAVDEIRGMNGLPKGWAENDTLRYISSAEDAHRAAAVARSRGYPDLARELEEGTRTGLGRSGRRAAPAAGAAESVGTKGPQTTAATDAPPRPVVWETPEPWTPEADRRALYDEMRRTQQRTQQEAQRLDQVEAQQRALVREQVAARDAAERAAAQGEPYRDAAERAAAQWEPYGTGSRASQPNLPPPGDTGAQPQEASSGSVWPWVGLGAAGLGGAYMLGRGGQREPNIAPPGR